MKISVIGAGAMGGATVEGLLKGNYVKAADICVSDASQKAVERFANSGAIVTTDNNAAAKWGDMVLVFVKPWLVEQVLTGIKDTLDYKRQTLVVVAAGIKGEQLKAWMTKDGQLPSMFLAIPNIAIAQLASMTFLVSVATESQHTEQVKALFDSMGQEGGVELGFKADDAKNIVMQTMKGAVELLQATGLHPEAAIDLVTTPGGVTIKGLNEMEHAGFTSSVIKGLKAGAK